MDIQPIVEQLLDEIRQDGKYIRWLRRHAALLAPLPDGSFSTVLRKVDFDNLPHAEIIKVIRQLGGKWEKTENKNAHPGDIRIDYEREIDGIRVRCWAGQPPPSCKVVEVEEVIPEVLIPSRVIHRKKLVCAGQAEPLAVALAQANSQKPSTDTEQKGIE